MINCVCIGKVYDNNSRLIGYKLQDTTGKEIEMKTGALKNAIRTGQIAVSNLELTENNRLKYIKVRCFILDVENGKVISEQEIKSGEKLVIDDDDYYSAILKIVDNGKVIEVPIADWELTSDSKHRIKRTMGYDFMGEKVVRYNVEVYKGIKIKFEKLYYAHYVSAEIYTITNNQ